MNNPWDQTIQITEDIAKEVIEEQKILKVSSIEIFGEGFDNVAYLVNNEFVFRFPRREMGIECLENEITLLPYIAGKISFPITSPIFIGKPSKLYPYPFAGYKMIPGKPVCEIQDSLIHNTNFAKTLASWLKQLHSIKIEEAHYSLIKGDQSWRLDVQDRLTKCINTINNHQMHYEKAGFSREELMNTIEKLKNLKFKNEKKAYLHGDLYCAHILIDRNLNIKGLIDWGDVHIGNPGIDLAIAIMLLKDETQQFFFETYGPVDQDTKNIAIFRAFCHSVMLLTYAYEKEKKSLQIWAELALENAIEKIDGMEIA